MTPPLHVWKTIHIYSHRENLFIQQILVEHLLEDKKYHPTSPHKSNYFSHCVHLSYCVPPSPMFESLTNKNYTFLPKHIFSFEYNSQCYRTGFFPILKITHSLDHCHLPFLTCFLCQDNIFRQLTLTFTSQPETVVLSSKLLWTLFSQRLPMVSWF